MRLLRQIAEIACLKLAEQEAELDQAYEKLDQILLEQAPKGQSPFARMVSDAPDQDLFLLLLEFCVARAWNSETAKALPAGVSLEFAARYSETSPQAMGELRELYRYACRFLTGNPSPLPFFHHPFQADERLLGYLCGDHAIDPILAREGVRLLNEPPAHPLFARHALREQLDAILCRKTVSVVHLAGDSGSGRSFLLHHALYTGERPLLLVDYRRLADREEKESRRLGQAVAREALFSHADVCYANISRKNCPDPSALLRFQDCCLNPLRDLGHNVCVTTDQETALIPFLEPSVEKLVLPELDRGERIALWEGFCHLYGLEGKLDCQSAGTKFRLTPRQIGRAARRLQSRGGDSDPVTEQEVADACAQVLPPPRQGSIRLISTPYTLEDIKVPGEVKQKLRSICAHVRHSRLVYDVWGMESRYVYGKTVSALLVGPPGTGKTMAAHILSNELSIPLYRIDLSQVVDKYIGETEKRLEEIFQAAERSNTILFFDEADAIFGKRSEVNDAHDKYANTEVSYILQRIEQYDGIVILATNYKKNIDEAFMRRMRYLVEFTMPAKEERLAIWQAAFPRATPLEQVDFAYLARQFELSGGSIKNIVINAAFLAAEQGSAIGMRHILESLRDENFKLGKPMLKQDFAEYAKLSEERLGCVK